MSHTRILIIGIGNPLRSDDGLGWSVAQELLREIQRDDVRVVAAHQLTPEMAEQVSRAETVIFIDSSRTGKPGSVRRQPVLPTQSAGHLSHDLSVPDILAVAQELYGCSPTAYMITVTGESFATGDRLSPKVSAAVPRLKSEVFRLLGSKTAVD